MRSSGCSRTLPRTTSLRRTAENSTSGLTGRLPRGFKCRTRSLRQRPRRSGTAARWFRSCTRAYTALLHKASTARKLDETSVQNPAIYLFLETNRATGTRTLYMERDLHVDAYSSEYARGMVRGARQGMLSTVSGGVPPAYEGATTLKPPVWTVPELYRYTGPVPSDASFETAQALTLENRWVLNDTPPMQFLVLMRLRSPEASDRQATDVPFSDRGMDSVVIDPDAVSRKVTFYWTRPQVGVTMGTQAMEVRIFFAVEKETNALVAGAKGALARIPDKEAAWARTREIVEESLAAAMQATYGMSNESVVPATVARLLERHPQPLDEQDGAAHVLTRHPRILVFRDAVEEVRADLGVVFPRGEEELRDLFQIMASPFLWLQHIDRALQNRDHGGMPFDGMYARDVLEALEREELLSAYRGMRDRRRGGALVPLDRAVVAVADKVAERVEVKTGRNKLERVSDSVAITGTAGSVD